MDVRYEHIFPVFTLMYFFIARINITDIFCYDLTKFKISHSYFSPAFCFGSRRQTWIYMYSYCVLCTIFSPDRTIYLKYYLFLRLTSKLFFLFLAHIPIWVFVNCTIYLHLATLSVDRIPYPDVIIYLFINVFRHINSHLTNVQNNLVMLMR